jgi:hypothetical protein
MEDMWREIEEEAAKITVRTDNPDWDWHAKFAEECMRSRPDMFPDGGRFVLIDVVYEPDNEGCRFFLDICPDNSVGSIG